MKLQELDASSLLALRDKWLSYLSAESHPVLVTEYHQLFDRINSSGSVGSLSVCFNKSLFACVGDGKDHWAMVELVQSQKGKAVWVKMMDIYMSPQIDAAPDDSEENSKKRLDVFTASLTGIFELTKGIKGVDTVKVYGRTDALVTFLRGMRDAFSVMASLGTITGVEVSIDGRWLVFRAA